MERTRHGPVTGLIAVWHDEEGWGVIRSHDVDGEIWAHFSNIEMSGYHELHTDEEVRLTYETPGQDGYPHRAITITKGTRNN
jgi:cold shock protein